MNKVYALFEFEAELDCELSIYSGEELQLVDDRDNEEDDGWTKVCNSNGNIGIVPSTYIQVGNLPDLPYYEAVEHNSDRSNFTNRDRSNSIVTHRRPSDQKISTKSILRNNEKRNIEKFFLEEPFYQSIVECQIILNSKGNSIYKPRSTPYKVEIIGNQSDKKYLGLKAFVTYEIKTDTLTLTQTVKRRYNHFVWLYSVLEERYPNIILPALPEKVVTGNFSKDLIESRKSQLELWLNRLSAHPVIGECETFIHFLQSDETKWKSGKRKAENDDLKGVQWLNKVEVPINAPGDIRETMDKFARGVGNLDGRVRDIAHGLDRLSLYQGSSFKREFISLGKNFEKCGNVLNDESLDAENNFRLADAFLVTGNVYDQIGNMYGGQPKDVKPLLDRFALYHRILQRVPNLLHFEKNSAQTFLELAKLPENNVDAIKPRRDLITHITLAEMNFLNGQKVDDMNLYMREFLANQVDFYAQISTCLQRALVAFQQIPLVNSKVD